MGKYQNEAASWQKDKARFVSGEWSKETLIAVSIWRCWNNMDIATRPRGHGAYAGAQNQQRETWRTFVACAVADGGLDALDLEIDRKVRAWLDEQGFRHHPERDTSGGEESVEFAGSTIQLYQADNTVIHLPRLAMPGVLKKGKLKTLPA